MSQENVDALRRVYEQLAEGNFWAAREIFHPEITWKWSSSMSGLTGVDTYHGIEGRRGSDPRPVRSLGLVLAGGRGVHRGRR